ncbi:hypothetical protein GCM10009765_32800 [Fodinicola feengrottensis]|uniref:Beta/gamma crystallin 'Greek key' domain-containing protein n=1 Tax=Fodinicola feengrottensis TaxID=435914 RepID=A0ABN2H3C1_9ACTN
MSGVRISRVATVLLAAVALVSVGSGLPASASESAGTPAKASAKPGIQLTIKQLPRGASPQSVAPGCGYDHEIDFMIETTVGPSFYCYHGQGSMNNLMLVDATSWVTWGTNGGSFTHGTNNSQCSQRAYFNPGNLSGPLYHDRICDLTLN